MTFKLTCWYYPLSLNILIQAVAQPIEKGNTYFLKKVLNPKSKCNISYRKP